jgi:hypothetical protein
MRKGMEMALKGIVFMIPILKRPPSGITTEGGYAQKLVIIILP